MKKILLFIVIIIWVFCVACSKEVQYKNSLTKVEISNDESEINRLFENVVVNGIYDIYEYSFTDEVSYIEIWLDEYVNGEKLPQVVDFKSQLNANKGLIMLYIDKDSGVLKIAISSDGQTLLQKYNLSEFNEKFSNATSVIRPAGTNQILLGFESNLLTNIFKEGNYSFGTGSNYSENQEYLKDFPYISFLNVKFNEE